MAKKLVLDADRLSAAQLIFAPEVLGPQPAEHLIIDLERLTPTAVIFGSQVFTTPLSVGVDPIYGVANMGLAPTFGDLSSDSEGGGGVELSGGHVPARQPYGGHPSPMTQAETHRWVQRWWREQEERSKKRARDPNLDNKATGRINTDTRTSRGAPSYAADAAGATHLALQEFELSDEEITAVVMLLEDDFFEERA